MSNIVKRLRREGSDERELDVPEQRRVGVNGRSIIAMHRVIQHNLGHDVVQSSDLAPYPMHAPQLSDPNEQPSDYINYPDVPGADTERDEFSTKNIEYLNFLAGSGLVNPEDIDLRNAA